MTRTQAESAVKAFFERRGLKTGKLNAHGHAALQVGTTPVSFSWDAKARVLICRALVYRFEDKPKPKILERVLKAAPSLELDAPSRALSMVSRLEVVPDAEGFDAAVAQLVSQALLWAGEKLAESV